LSLVILMSVLGFAVSNYPFGIFKLFLFNAKYKEIIYFHLFINLLQGSIGKMVSASLLVCNSQLCHGRESECKDIARQYSE
jgi:hypothetical protein